MNNLNMMMYMFMMSIMLMMMMKKYILMMLMTLEIMMMTMMMLMNTLLNTMNLQYMILFYIIMTICEGILGLTILLLMIQFKGSDKLNNLNLIMW